MSDFLTRPYDYTRSQRTLRSPLVSPRHFNTGSRWLARLSWVLVGVLITTLVLR